ncbi:hemagglutinin [Actinomyces bowdenii]|uniref:hemagglutinin n=1 Tax=Actinomyces bowdenii TaxID=131109 RepID=UPI00214B1465|nr:hemagglutinin [Actinomyces bowdenii]MCR2051406.1 hemagglutinin [Actinomyces bowdenii]
MSGMSPPPSGPGPRAHRSPRGPGASRRAHVPGRARPVRRRPARRRPQRRILRGPLGIILAAFLITVLLGLVVLRLSGPQGQSTSAAVFTEPAAVAPDPTGFEAASIIDDEVFYDSQAMTRAEVEEFISQVNEGCMPGLDGTPCLAQATFDVEPREATSFCPGQIDQQQGASAGRVIWEVAQSCDINPQVLLVLIQKEQGLLTASGATLTARDYEAAAGYGCPDGAACDTQWSGFVAQLYGAASQYQRYRLDPGAYDVQAEVPTQVAYSPEARCGSAELTVVNQATAALYNYTPYQPNEAAASGGDGCTAWGNWNFYGYFRVFFGDPTPSRA